MSVRVNEDLAVSVQIACDQLEDLAKQGVTLLICNRPDGEEPNQPNFSEIQTRAAAVGIEALYQPVIPGQISDQAIVEFGNALLTANGKVLAYCRTGTRSITLWALSQAREGQNVDELLQAARDAGYDLAGIRDRLDQLSKEAL
jgi:sulfide:quinone oxidoreductase